MGLWRLNNVTTADTYTPANTLSNLPFPTKITIDVAGAAIFWQIAQASGPSGLNTEGTWQDEVFLLPSSKPLFRAGVRGIRVRSAVAGKPAQVTVEASQ